MPPSQGEAAAPAELPAESQFVAMHAQYHYTAPIEGLRTRRAVVGVGAQSRPQVPSSHVVRDVMGFRQVA